jgi:hypothetical protein
LVRGLPCSGISGTGVCSRVGFIIAGKISSRGVFDEDGCLDTGTAI